MVNAPARGCIPASEDPSPTPAYFCGLEQYEVVLTEGYDRPLGRDYAFWVARCLGCSLARTLPVPDPDQYAQGYAQTTRDGFFVGSSSDGWSAWAAGYVRARSSGSRLLDVGCHVGNLVVAAGSLGFDARGIDIDPLATAEAKRLGRRVATCSIEDVGDTYDVVVLCHVLEHIVDLRQFLQGVSQVIVAGGRAFVFVPHYRGLIPRLMGNHWMAWSPSQHVWHFKPSTLIRVVEASSPLRFVNCTTRGVIEPPSSGIKGRVKAVLSSTSHLLGWGDSIEAIFEKPRGVV
jgi:SAM-dependent methyltransferase